MSDVNGVALAVLILLFALVTGMGFWATRWRRPTSMESLDEWGLGGRSFGTWITWFLLGGDLYTAYTFVAVPAAMWAAGSVSGFFAVPYTIVLYPIIFIFMGRMWSVSHRHGYVTTADFVRGRFGSRGLSLAVAVTGFVATMPYIALQLVGIQAVLEVVGLGGGDSVIAQDLPLFIAFALLAAYTYSSGLRAPAVIAFVKDTLIYLVIIVAIIYLPTKFGGWEHIFGAAQEKMAKPNPVDGKPNGVFIPGEAQHWAYATLGLGSALALFMYPHSITASLSASTRNTVRRNAAILPAYSFVLGLLALLGWVAIAAGTKPIGANGKPNAQLVIPQLFEDSFPSWFAGVAFAAIAIGALVPAAIMSIAAANTFTRNIYKEWLKPDATPSRRPRSPSWPRSSSSCSPWCSCCCSTSRTPSTSSCSAASGSSRPSRRSSWVSTPGGCTAGRCWPAGRSAWSTAPGRPGTWPTRERTSITSVARSRRCRSSGSSATSRSPRSSSTSSSRSCSHSCCG